MDELAWNQTAFQKVYLPLAHVKGGFAQPLLGGIGSPIGIYAQYAEWIESQHHHALG